VEQSTLLCCAPDRKAGENNGDSIVIWPLD
jgi:hypothetical protein